MGDAVRPRVLFISEFSGFAGGIERFIFDTAQQLRGVEHETLDASGETGELRDEQHPETISGTHLPPPGKNPPIAR